MTDMASAIDTVTARLWPEGEVRVTPIAAGLTNQNFRNPITTIHGAPLDASTCCAGTKQMNVP